MPDRNPSLALPLGIVLIGVANLVSLLIGETEIARFVAGVLLGLGIAAEFYVVYALGGRDSR
jgi:hypothetical protein